MSGLYSIVKVRNNTPKIPGNGIENIIRTPQATQASGLDKSHHVDINSDNALEKQPLIRTEKTQVNSSEYAADRIAVMSPNMVWRSILCIGMDISFGGYHRTPHHLPNHIVVRHWQRQKSRYLQRKSHKLLRPSITNPPCLTSEVIEAKN